MVLNPPVIRVGQIWKFIKQAELLLLESGQHCDWLNCTTVTVIVTCTRDWLNLLRLLYTCTTELTVCIPLRFTLKKIAYLETAGCI